MHHSPSVIGLLVCPLEHRHALQFALDSRLLQHARGLQALFLHTAVINNILEFASMDRVQASFLLLLELYLGVEISRFAPKLCAFRAKSAIAVSGTATKSSFSLIYMSIIVPTSAKLLGSKQLLFMALSIPLNSFTLLDRRKLGD